jgi:hypothetical protein
MHATPLYAFRFQNKDAQHMRVDSSLMLLWLVAVWQSKQTN